MGIIKEAIKFILILISVIGVLIIISIVLNTFDRRKENYMNIEVTQQLKDVCSKEADEIICD